MQGSKLTTLDCLYAYAVWMKPNNKYINAPSSFFQMNIGRELSIGSIALEDFVLRLISPQRVFFRLEWIIFL
jgi:hypothetical protein